MKQDIYIVPTPKCKWGVQIGQPTKHMTASGRADIITMSNIGKWCMGAIDPNGRTDYSRPRLFATRREARANAREQCQGNRFWNFHARKYHGK